MTRASDARTDHRDVLAYLLKHGAARLLQLVDEKLQPWGIDGKELGVLRVLAGREPASQLELAGILGVDRTTMVSLLDGLDSKGLLTRQPDPADRRRNVAALTDEGLSTFDTAESAYADAEKAFLAPVEHRDAEHLRQTLRALLQE